MENSAFHYNLQDPSIMAFTVAGKRPSKDASGGLVLISFPISQINLFHFIHGLVYGIRLELKERISIRSRLR